jgi:hypothetical protein
VTIGPILGAQSIFDAILSLSRRRGAGVPMRALATDAGAHFL